MKTHLLSLVVLGAAALASSCSHLDTTPPGAADRVLTGVVTAGPDAEGLSLPADAEVTVRVVDLSNDLSHGEELGEQIIKGPVTLPVPFRIEYRAEDADLLRTISVEARIAVGRQLRYASAGENPITLANVNQQHVVIVQPATNP